MSKAVILPGYSLEMSESGKFYLLGPAVESSGGVIDGTVQEIGWKGNFIFAKRLANYRGDPDGWMYH